MEGYDQEPMQEPDEAMEEFPFNLDGDGGDAGKTGGLLFCGCASARV